MTPGHDHVNRLREETFRVLEPRFEGIEKEIRGLYSLLLQTFGQIEQRLRDARDVDFTPAIGVLTEAFQDEIRRQAENMSSLEHFVSEVRRLETQEEILGFLLDSAHRYASRLALFATRAEQIHGWSSRGYDEETAAGISSYTSSAGNPLFARALSSRGRMAFDELTDAPGLVELLSPGASGPWYFFPMTALSRSVALLVAAGSNEVTPHPEMLGLMMQLAGLRIENLALRILREMEVPAAPREPAPAPPEPEVEAPPPLEAVAGPQSEARGDETVEVTVQAEIPSSTEIEPPTEAPVEAYDAWMQPVEPAPQSETGTPEAAEPEPPAAVEYEAVESSRPAETGPVEVHAHPVEIHQHPVEVTEEPKTPPQLVTVDDSQRFVEEERLHSDAKRFARLLVSEIKLYNERRVLEGRENRDVYVRLKRDIDRSRDMYRKRVSPTVSRKIDYFHDELIRILGDNDPSNLGSDYPGPLVES